MLSVIARGSVSRSSSRSFSSKSTTKSTSTSTKSSPTTTKPTAPKTSTKAGTSKAKPGSTVKTTSGKTVKTSSTKPTNSKYTRSTGVVGDNGYSPRFSNGYRPPEGSVVYVPQHGVGDYIFWYYLFNHNSPRNDQATVVQPDNKQVTATPERSGVDGMFVLNWVILIIVVLAIIGGIVYLVNRLTGRKK